MNDNEKKRKITDTTCVPILAIGLMSGTSLDGIDAAIIYTDGEKIIDLGACIEIKMPKDFEYVDDAGIKMGMRWSPIDSVGLYVPGGTASYPSSV